MSTLTADPPTTSHAATPPAAAQVQPTFAGVMRGEWIKLLSLRSTWWALASTAAVITLVSLAAAMSLNAMADDPLLASSLGQMHGAEVIAQGFHFGMLTIAVLGALFITGEYSTGMVRSTFAAVPTRIPVLAAKALTLTALTAAVTLLPERAQNGHHSAARSIASKASANRPIPLHGAVLVDQGRRMLAWPIWPSARGCSPLRPPQSGSRHVADRGSAALPAPRPRPWPASRSW